MCLTYTYPSVICCKQRIFSNQINSVKITDKSIQWRGWSANDYCFVLRVDMTVIMNIYWPWLEWQVNLILQTWASWETLRCPVSAHPHTQISLPPPGGIVIRHVCWLVGSFVSALVRSLTSGQRLHWLPGGWWALGGEACGWAINITVSLQAPGGGLYPTSTFST